jgi:hypothetical protein
MNGTPNLGPLAGRFARLLWKSAIGILAFIGLMWLIGGTIIQFLAGPMFETEIVQRTYSPDRAAVAEVEVRKGGFGTVWTTRVHLRTAGTKIW